MAIPETKDSENTTRLLCLASQGDQAAWSALLNQDGGPLRRMVDLRLDRRFRGRVDASDVIQEAHLEAARRLAEYSRNPQAPFFLWLRFLVGQELMAVHRRRLGAQARDAGREISLFRGSLPEATSAALAAQLPGRDTRPSEALARAERKLRLEDALNRMDPLDREVLNLDLLTKDYGEPAGGIWAGERLANRIDAIIIHELSEAAAGTHAEAMRLAPETERPISEGTRKILHAMRDGWRGS
jgi:RNA polymerase sigma-70 factor (ECF subfamily)